MANRQRHDSGVETDSDESATMSVESPRIHHHQLDEGITDAPAAPDLTPQEVKVVEIPRLQQMDTEAAEDNRPSTSRVGDVLGNASNVEKSVKHLPSSNAALSAGGKMVTRHIRTKSQRAQRVYSKKNPRKSDDAGLLDAAARNDFDKCALLLKQGANIQGEDSRKRTALHFAATHRGNGDLVRLLLDWGADPNVQDMAGNTPLHLAICINNTPATFELLKNGSDVTALDRSGRNPVELARSRMKVIWEASRKGEVTQSVRREAIRMIAGLRAYLIRNGNSSADILGSFEERISAPTSSKQFSSDVSDVLASLQHLQL